jgi:hypothetical protein
MQDDEAALRAEIDELLKDVEEMMKISRELWAAGERQLFRAIMAGYRGGN